MKFADRYFLTPIKKIEYANSKNKIDPANPDKNHDIPPLVINCTGKNDKNTMGLK
jgi:hypothetical protein